MWVQFHNFVVDKFRMFGYICGGVLIAINACRHQRKSPKKFSGIDSIWLRSISTVKTKKNNSMENRKLMISQLTIQIGNCTKTPQTKTSGTYQQHEYEEKRRNFCSFKLKKSNFTFLPSIPQDFFATAQNKTEKFHLIRSSFILIFISSKLMQQSNIFKLC